MDKSWLVLEVINVNEFEVHGLFEDEDNAIYWAKDNLTGKSWKILPLNEGVTS